MLNLLNHTQNVSVNLLDKINDGYTNEIIVVYEEFVRDFQLGNEHFIDKFSLEFYDRKAGGYIRYEIAGTLGSGSRAVKFRPTSDRRNQLKQLGFIIDLFELDTEASYTLADTLIFKEDADGSIYLDSLNEKPKRKGPNITEIKASPTEQELNSIKSLFYYSIGTYKFDISDEDPKIDAFLLEYYDPETNVFFCLTRDEIWKEIIQWEEVEFDIDRHHLLMSGEPFVVNVIGLDGNIIDILTLQDTGPREKFFMSIMQES